MSIGSHSTRYRFDPGANRLDILHNAGFFSVCSITLDALMELHPASSPIRVNWPSQNLFRNAAQEGNLFDSYFEPRTDFDASLLKRLPGINPNGSGLDYRDLDFASVCPYVDAYYRPSRDVLAKQREVADRYSIEPEKTVALFYRGTDKWSEVPPIHVDCFIDQAIDLLRSDDRLRVLIQTDSLQDRQRCLSRIGERSFAIDEMPATDGTQPIHKIPHGRRGLDNLGLGTLFLGVVGILSRCRYVITSRGNIGLWLYLFRGHARGTIQLGPPAAVEYWIRMRLPRALKKRVNRALYSRGWRHRTCVAVTNLP